MTEAGMDSQVREEGLIVQGHVEVNESEWQVWILTLTPVSCKVHFFGCLTSYFGQCQCGR